MTLSGSQWKWGKTNIFSSFLSSKGAFAMSCLTSVRLVWCVGACKASALVPAALREGTNWSGFGGGDVAISKALIGWWIFFCWRVRSACCEKLCNCNSFRFVWKDVKAGFLCHGQSCTDWTGDGILWELDSELRCLRWSVRQNMLLSIADIIDSRWLNQQEDGPRRYCIDMWDFQVNRDFQLASWGSLESCVIVTFFSCWVT